MALIEWPSDLIDFPDDTGCMTGVLVLLWLCCHVLGFMPIGSFEGSDNLRKNHKIEKKAVKIK